MKALIYAAVLMIASSVAFARSEVIEGCSFNEIYGPSALSPYIPKISAPRGYDIVMLKGGEDLAEINGFHVSTAEGYSEDFSISAKGDRTYVFRGGKVDFAVVIKAGSGLTTERIGFLYDLTKSPALKAAQLICF